MHKLLYILLLFLLVACDKKQVIVEDPVTENMSISSVAEDADNGFIAEGNDFFIRGEYNTAIEYYEDAMQLNKAVSLYNIGVSYYLLGNLKEAEINFKEAIATDPAFNEAIMNLVAVLAQQERVNEAEFYLEKIVDTTKSSRVYIDMGNLLLQKGDTSRALYYYSLAIDKDPDSNYVKSNYSSFLVGIGEYEEGIKLLEQIRARNFNDNYNLAHALYEMGDSGGAYNYAVEAQYSPSATNEGYSKLAYLFYDLGRYKSEIQVLKVLISRDSNKENRIRLVTSYINAVEYPNALDELSNLIKLYPDNVFYSILYYDTLILDMKVKEGGEYIRNLYKKFGGDMALYYYTKHLALFENLDNDLKKRIFIKRNSEWLNLARTVYSLREGNIKAAQKYLSLVTPNIGHDYYSYNAYINIVEKNFKVADKFALQMDKTRPDTFWYRTVIGWNLGQSDVLVALAEEFRDNKDVFLRSPKLTFSLIAQLDDMNYTYKFDGKGIDIASMMAFPVFINPDDLVQFLAMSGESLNMQEKDAVIANIEAVKRNNEGVDAFQKYNFDKAIRKFKEATEVISANPNISYNIGLAYFNLGDNINALEFFEKAIIQDKSLAAPYVGLGFIENRFKNSITSNINLALAEKTAGGNLHATPKGRLENSRIVYLSLLASGRFGMLEEARQVVKSNDGFIFSAEKFMEYVETQNKDILDSFLKSPVFRVNEINKLLKLQYEPINNLKLEESDDIYFTLARQYVLMKRGVDLKGGITKRFLNDKVYLKDMVYTSINQNNKKDGLKYLQQLTDIDFKYPDLYKTSLYYFLWLRDLVNAEASLGSLDRMEYQDKITDFYKMIYYLISYNRDQIDVAILNYLDQYSTDYKVELISAMNNLNQKNIPAYYNLINLIFVNNKDLFDKIFIGVNFESF